MYVYVVHRPRRFSEHGEYHLLDRALPDPKLWPFRERSYGLDEQLFSQRTEASKRVLTVQKRSD